MSRPREVAKAQRIPPDEHGIDPQWISAEAWKVMRGLNKAGYDAYLVGGAVRDMLLGLHPKDFDIATDATPEQVRRVFRRARLIGRRFRIVHVRFGREIIEVATFRGSHDDAEDEADARSDAGRLVRDNVYGTLESDVWRRDFTANALYYDASDQSVVDFVGGVADIRQRKLKMIGDPRLRFTEDPVRILRAVRFAAKLDFEISPSIRPLMTEMKQLIAEGSPARLFDEMIKLLHGGAARKTFELLREYDLFDLFFPGAERQLQRDPEGIFHRLVRIALDNTDHRIAVGKPVTPAFLLAVMMWDDVKFRAERAIQNKKPAAQSWQQASQGVLSEQVRVLTIPRRFSLVAKEIWLLQPRFNWRRGKRALAVLNHARFRAAYDLLCLRDKAGENGLSDDVKFWTDIQELSESEQFKLLKLQDRRESPRNFRPRRRRKKSSN